MPMTMRCASGRLRLTKHAAPGRYRVGRQVTDHAVETIATEISISRFLAVKGLSPAGRKPGEGERLTWRLCPWQ